MTDTKLDFEIVSGCYELLPNDVLCKLTRKNFEEVNTPTYSEDGLELAKALSKSLPLEQVTNKREIIRFKDENEFIHNQVIPVALLHKNPITGSSDVGDVSWLMPLSMIFTATWPLGVNPHTWQAASSSGHSIGQKGMLYAAKIMTGIIYDVFNDSEILKNAKAEFKNRTSGKTYKCPIK